MMVTRTLCALFVLFAGVALAQPQFEPVVVNRFSLRSPSREEAPPFPQPQRVRYVPRGQVSDESTVMVHHEQQEGDEMRFREKQGIPGLGWAKKTYNKLKTKAGEVARKIADKLAPQKSSSGGSSSAPTVGKRPEDIEDCTACRFIWLQVEMQVGNSQIEENIYDAFTQACIEAQKAPIFYPACEDMFDDVYGMIGDYMDGYTVSQVCEGAKMCR